MEGTHPLLNRLPPYAGWNIPRLWLLPVALLLLLFWVVAAWEAGSPASSLAVCGLSGCHGAESPALPAFAASVGACVVGAAVLTLTSDCRSVPRTNVLPAASVGMRAVGAVAVAAMWGAGIGGLASPTVPGCRQSGSPCVLPPLTRDPACAGAAADAGTEAAASAAAAFELRPQGVWAESPCGWGFADADAGGAAAPAASAASLDSSRARAVRRAARSPVCATTSEHDGGLGCC
eukprot:1157384-Pelagomonas_calceolata.AAC.4